MWDPIDISIAIWWMVSVLQQNNLRTYVSLNDNSWGQNTTKKEFGLKASHGKSDSDLQHSTTNSTMDSRLFTSEIIEKNLPACCLLPSSIGGSSSNWTSLHLVTNKFNSSLSGAAFNGGWASSCWASWKYLVRWVKYWKGLNMPKTPDS